LARFNDSSIGYGPLADRPSSPSGTSTRAAWIGSSAFSAWEGSTWTQYGFADLAIPVTIPQGGHGQTSAVPGFNALSPQTTKGDLITRDTTNDIRLAIGADMALLRADSTQTPGMDWARRPTPYTMFAGFQGTGSLWTFPGGGGDPLGGGNQINYHKLDFSPYREARVTVRGRNTVLSAGNVDFLVYDVTNTQNITSATANFPNSGAFLTKTSVWASLNAATYAGDAEFELRVANGAAGDNFDVGTVILELR
jgi:hypothetical protein